MSKHSYIVVNRDTGEAVLEFFNKDNARHINQAKYKVVTAIEYLCELNKAISAQQS